MNYLIASNRPFPGASINNPEELHKLAKKKSTTIFFPFWSWLIPGDIIEQHRCIGFHSGPLPLGKGGSPIQNMIRLGYKTTQLCMFGITPKLDSGEVLARLEVPITGTLRDIIDCLTGDIQNLIDDYVNKTDYSKVPVSFKRITTNLLPEAKNLKALYNEIRMRDEEGHPKAHKYHGKYVMEFTDAKLEGDCVNARVKFIKR